MVEPSLKLSRYDLEGLDPYHNLAVEEHLARTCPEDTVRLVFYRNAPALVIGRNQNPWVEADLVEAARLGVAVARRVSGGGTVVHDEGNLNYGFVVPRALYAPPRFLQIVVEALGTLGITASACTRNSVWVHACKVSGTAFLLTGRSALLHGCVLVDSDLDRLRRLLAPPAADRRTHAVPSIRSPVLRLCDVSSAVTVDAVREAIAASATQDLVGATGPEPSSSEPSATAVAALTARLRSWEWLFGRTPDFEHVLHLTEGEVTLQVKGAHVAAVLAQGSAELGAVLPAIWSGCRYDGALLAASLAGAAALGAEAKADLAGALRREIPALGSHLSC